MFSFAVPFLGPGAAARLSEEPNPLPHMNPLSDLQSADPGAIRVDSAATVTYYMACTKIIGDASPGAFHYFTSNNMVDWAATGEKLMPESNLGAWSTEKFWAPEIHRVGPRYITYFSAEKGLVGHGDACLGAATSSTPDGPYTDIGHPLLCSGDVGLGRVALIDAHYFNDEVNGRRYLYWKTDYPTSPKRIHAIELGPGGLAPVGELRTLIKNDLTWEGGSVEGPWVIRRNSFYYLFYSGASFKSNYKVGVARSSSPTGTFTNRGPPILKGNSTYASPGHNSVLQAWNRMFMIYHAYPAGESDRVPMLDRIDWSNGWPKVNDGTPSIGQVVLVP